MGALVDHVEAVVAPVLFDGEVAGVAGAAQHLDSLAVGLQRPFAGPALGNRSQQLQQQVGLLGFGFGAGLLVVHQLRAQQAQGQAALDHALLHHQHALDVAVLNDRDLRTAGVFASSRHGAALRAILGIGQRGFIAGIAQHGRAQAHANAGLVHQREHALEALTGLADQVAHRAGLAVHRELAFAKVQQGVDGAPVATLVVQARQGHIVALVGDGAVGLHQLARHDEQRNALDTGDGLAIFARDLGQHQVHDVLAHLVLTARDPHLVALEAKARAQRVLLPGRSAVGFAARVGHRLGGDVRQAGARLRLAQAHGAEGAALQARLGKHLDLLGGAVRQDGVGVAARQHGVAAQGHAGLEEEAHRRHLHHGGQLHAAHIGIFGGGHQARVDEGLQGLRGLGRQVHALTVELGLLQVGQAVDGGELLGGDLLAQVQHRIEGVAAVLGVAGALAQGIGLQPVVEQEVEGGTLGHDEKRIKSG